MRVKSVWRGFVESHKYRGEWNKGWLAVSIGMDTAITMMIVGGVFLGIRFDPTGGAYLGLWLLIGGIFAFVISCFDIFENYPVPPEDREEWKKRYGSDSLSQFKH